VAQEKPAGEIWRRRMAETLAAALSQLEAAKAGATVHAARRQLKRARALLRLAKPALAGSAFVSANRELKRAADRLAVTRRAEAMREAVHKLAPKAGKPAAAVTSLIGIAESAHRQTASGGELQQAVADALASIAAVQAMLADADVAAGGRKPYVKALRQTYGQARRALARGLATGDIETLHEARKFAIRHLHHLEFFSPLWPRLFEAWTAEVQHLRQALGDLHDLAELQALLAETDTPYGKLAEKDEALVLIGKRRKRLLQRIENRQPRLFAEPPKALARRIEAMWRKEAGNPGQGRDGR
jgi:CHAD domain-containing protein